MRNDRYVDEEFTRDSNNYNWDIVSQYNLDVEAFDVCPGCGYCFFLYDTQCPGCKDLYEKPWFYCK
jgi:rubrerythrin